MLKNSKLKFTARFRLDDFRLKDKEITFNSLPKLNVCATQILLKESGGKHDEKDITIPETGRRTSKIYKLSTKSLHNNVLLGVTFYNKMELPLTSVRGRTLTMKKNESQIHTLQTTIEQENPKMKQKVAQILKKYKETIAEDRFDIGNPEVPPLEMTLEPGSTPYRQKPYRMPPQKQEECKQQIAELVKSKVIQPSKKEGRLAVLLNYGIKKDISYQQSKIKQVISSLKQKQARRSHQDPRTWEDNLETTSPGTIHLLLNIGRQFSNLATCFYELSTLLLNSHIVTCLNCSLTACVDPEFSGCLETAQQRPMSFSQKAIPCPSGELEFNGKQCFTKTNECNPNKNDTPQQCPDGYFYTPFVNTRECSAQMCVPLKDSKCPIAGGWSEWSIWSDCEPECGGDGIQTRRRDCNNPIPENGGPECPGTPIDIRECKSPNCTEPANPAFMVSLQETTHVNAENIQWSSIDVNDDNLYNSVTKEVRIKKPGMYFFSITTRTEKGTYMGLENSGVTVGLYKRIMYTHRTTTNTISRSALYFLSSIHRPFINHYKNNSILFGTERGKETAWVGFRYETNNYICAATDKISLASSKPLDIVIALRGFTMSPSKQIIYSRQAGLYYINFGGGIKYHQSDHKIEISTNNFIGKYSIIHSKIYFGGYRQPTYHLSRGFLHNMKAHERLQLHGSRHYTSPMLESYITAFQLNESLPAVFGYNNLTQCSSTLKTLTFDTIAIDTSNSWNRAGVFTAPINATYFIELSIVAHQAEAHIEVNNGIAFTLHKNNNHNRYAELVSRTGLVKLKVGDTCKVMYRGCVENTDM
ncbi:DgyrCDS14789 [Dimorphilus gyrociliatus]|uniref:DgyrCDS14789 n=1 Tax=Dimorphilus gyrociliatus TaxID=2664684 RepID=A0A7I8WEW9_9ANNE|nr:DgyrCDS14789 [Dimorphilus gyrociliatus]